MVFPYHIVTKSAQETQSVGAAFAAELIKDAVVSSQASGRATTICLFGELGAGKTTFAQGFAKGLGFTQRLVSPTFLFLRTYTGEKNLGRLYHFDLYQLKTEKQLVELGFLEFICEPHAYVFIEWADRARDLLPPSRFDVSLVQNGAIGHSIDIQRYG